MIGDVIVQSRCLPALLHDVTMTSYYSREVLVIHYVI
jgi:hypothetical protein